MESLTEGIEHLIIPSENEAVLFDQSQSTENELPRQMSPLLQLLRQYALFENLSWNLDSRDFTRLKQLCKDFYIQANWSTQRKKRWDVNRRLLRFVDNPIGFRTELGLHDAIIAGSFVIQFFDNILWEDSDLDIFVKHGDGAKALWRYLLQNERYRPDPLKDYGNDHRYSSKCIVEVRSMVREDGDEPKKVKIISTRSIPIQTIVGDNYSTGLVNFMTWNKTFSMFPALTFVEPRKMIEVALLDSEKVIQIQKYRERGWTSVKILDNDAGASTRHFRCLDTTVIRRIGDGRTWKMELNTKDIDTPATPDYVLEHCPFEDSKHWCYRIVAHILPSCLLKYKYTLSNDLYRGIRWRSFLRSKLDPLVKEEVKNVDPVLIFEDTYISTIGAFW